MPNLKKLTPAQYDICFRKGTEHPGSGKYLKNYEDGTYHCVNCNRPLFSSSAKYDSKTGWPSFFQPIKEDAVKEIEDLSHGMRRIELACANCGAHLGHVFEDGPEPTGKRYCINSLALDFKKDEGKK